LGQARFFRSIAVQRLGQNIGGYRGETIGLPKVLLDIERAAAGGNWVRDFVPLPSSTAAQPLDFVAYQRLVESPRKRVYISTGIHGDEPAGPLAALRLLQDDQWPADIAFWLCPCLNPTGFSLNRRENYQGIDLNRDYRHLQTEEIRAHVAWLAKQPDFDVHLCLHEDWEAQGFYMYEVNPDQLPSLAERILEAVAKVCPIETATTVDTWAAEAGVIRPRINPAERPQWPEAIYLITHKTRLGYTMEAPSDFPMPVRVGALVAGVRAALAAL
jgi:murein peptide amidase A